MNGALLINKDVGPSSFGVIEQLQQELIRRKGIKKKDLPKLGHGGTLDPFASGLLPVCVGKAVKLARYFLGAVKTYEGTIRFGETTLPGDPTAPVSETSSVIPASLDEVRAMAHRLAHQPYLQTPPMFSAKKKDGKPLYELAREGIEVEREPKLCHLYEFEIQSYDAPRATFRLRCSSGTYVRALAQDFGRLLGTVALLETLNRTGTAGFTLARSMTIAEIAAQTAVGAEWDELDCWIPFDRLLDGYDRAEANHEEARALVHGQQGVLFNILKRVSPARPAASANGSLPQLNPDDSCVAIYHQDRLLAIARRTESAWGIERVFTGA